MRTPEEWAALDRAHLWHPFTQYEEWLGEDVLTIVRGDGVWVEDASGRRYLDGVSSLWCNVFGHRHPRIDAAVRDQLDRIAHSTLLGLTHPPAIELAARLAALTGLPRVFFSDSGSTAVEVALKMAFQAKQQRGEVARTRFAALTEAYHGDTIGSVSVGGMALFHGVYKPLLFDAARLPSPERADPADEAACLARAEALFAAEGPTLAAVVVEPLVQGAAGMRMHSPVFLARLVALAREAGAYVIADEVATGFGRTGTMFAVEQAGVRPDLMCVAKGLTGGYLPLAATLATEEIHDAFRGPYEAHRTFFHGHTYTGNPLACAAALATLDVFVEEHVLDGLPAKVDALAAALARLAAHPRVAEVRQKGLMAGVVLKPWEKRQGHRVALACREEGVILRCLGDTVVLMPPLAMGPGELGALGEGIEKALARV